MHLNEHLALSTTLCQPCVFNYTFYANFKYLPKDATRVMDKFDIPHHYYRDVENHPVYTTEELVEFFFRDMSQEKRSQSLKDLESRVGRRIEGIPSTKYVHSYVHVCVCVCVCLYMYIYTVVSKIFARPKFHKSLDLGLFMISFSRMANLFYH